MTSFSPEKGNRFLSACATKGEITDRSSLVPVTRLMSKSAVLPRRDNSIGNKDGPSTLSRDNYQGRLNSAFARNADFDVVKTMLLSRNEDVRILRHRRCNRAGGFWHAPSSVIRDLLELVFSVTFSSLNFFE
jgi:hypothetical protein